ncbi:YrhB domain-containing protein [Pseudoxanthomonas beigongshangi]
MAMLTKEQARRRVEARMRAFDHELPEGDAWVLIDASTIERPWGWVFFHTSRRWRETGDVGYAIAGNAPLLVERDTGRVLTTGTARPIEKCIEAYERTGDPHG